MRTAPRFAVIATAVVRTALWFCASNVLVAVLAAQCANPTQVPNQTIGSGTVNYWDNNALAASNVVIGGSASVSFAAGNCIHLQPGFQATAGTAPTTFHAWVDTAPTADWLSPSSGSGLSQQFTFAASSPAGYTNLSEMQALFNTSLSGLSACYIRYHRGANLLYLADNWGSSWMSGIVPGSSGTVANSQCGISGIGSSVSGSGAQLTLTVSVTFFTAFSGVKNEYLAAYDQYNLYSGWQQMGTWTVPGGTPQQYFLTTAVSPFGGGMISPASGWYNSGQVVQVSAAAISGYQFTGFSGALVGTITPQSLTMDGNKSVTANFVGSQYTATTLAGLDNCIQNLTQFTACVLAPGMYTVTSTIEINRSNLMVQGGTSGMNDTKLVRDPYFTGDLIRIGQNASVTGVALKYLTVCGGSDITRDWGPAPPSPVNCPRVPTVCGDRTKLQTQHPNTPDPPPQCVDIKVVRSALPVFPVDPFNNPPASYAVEFDHVDLEDATGHALSIRGFPGIAPSDIHFHHGAINYSGITGILIGADGVSYNRKDCDSFADPAFGFANALNVFLPRNLRFEHNAFTENRTGVAGGAARWVGMRDNVLISNYIWPQAQGGAVPGTNPAVGDPNESAGGTLEFDACADQIQLVNNTFIGPGSAHTRTQALELYGRNITVDMNEVSGYQHQGIVANSLDRAAIRNNTITFAAPSTPDGGITVTTVGAGDACTVSPLNIYRESKDISISGNSIWGQYYGVNLAEHPHRSTGAIHGLTIGTNYGNWSTAQYWQAPFVWANAYNGYIGPPMSLGPPLLALGITPRVLPVDSESVPTRALCSLPGAARASFTFAASDDSNGSANLPGLTPRLDYGAAGYAGAAQILYMEGIFSNAGPPVGPSNTSQDCHFLYAADTDPNVVYLDDGTGNWGPGSSPIGVGGHDLTNPNGCIIHAASSSVSDIKAGQYARSVTLDVEFLGASAKKHLYVYTRNKNGTVSYSRYDQSAPVIWQYWGWWQKP